MVRKSKSKRASKQRRELREKVQLNAPTVRVRKSMPFIFFCKIDSLFSKLFSVAEIDEIFERYMDEYTAYRVEYQDEELVCIYLQKRSGLFLQRVAIDGFAYTAFSRWTKKMDALYGFSSDPKVKVVQRPEIT